MLLRGIFNRERASSITLHTNDQHPSYTIHHAGAPAAHCCHLDGATVSRERSSGGASLHLLGIMWSITIIAMTSATARRRCDVTLLRMTRWAVPHHKNPYVWDGRGVTPGGLCTNLGHDVKRTISIPVTGRPQPNFPNGLLILIIIIILVTALSRVVL